jgi:hypothetical protein
MRVLREVRSGEWPAAGGKLSRMHGAWTRYADGGTAPVRLKGPMDRALFVLSHAIDARASHRAKAGAVDVAQAAVDLELPFLAPAEIDVARFDLWLHQLLLDAAAGDTGRASGDIAALEVTRDRFSAAIDPVALTRLNRDLLAMREDQVDGNLRRVVRMASDLLAGMSSVRPA